MYLTMVYVFAGCEAGALHQVLCNIRSNYTFFFTKVGWLFHPSDTCDGYVLSLGIFGELN